MNNSLELQVLQCPATPVLLWSAKKLESNQKKNPCHDKSFFVMWNFTLLQNLQMACDFHKGI